jgi:hypothetical protein
MTAGTITFGGSCIAALVLQKRTKTMRLSNSIVEEVEDNFMNRKSIVLDESFACSEFR